MIEIHPVSFMSKLRTVTDKLGDISTDIGYFWLAQVESTLHPNTNFTKLVKGIPHPRGITETWKTLTLIRKLRRVH